MIVIKQYIEFAIFTCVQSKSVPLVLVGFKACTEVLGCKSVPLVLAGFKARTEVLGCKSVPLVLVVSITHTHTHTHSHTHSRSTCGKLVWLVSLLSSLDLE